MLDNLRLSNVSWAELVKYVADHSGGTVKDGISPLLRNNSGNVEVSYDNGDSYSILITKDTLRGVDGKNAYEYAVEGGYNGTEELFKTKLATSLTLEELLSILLSYHDDMYLFADGDISSANSTLTLNIPDINVNISLERDGSNLPTSKIKTINGTANINYRRFSIFNENMVDSTVKEGDSIVLTSTPITIDPSLLMESNDTTYTWIRNEGTTGIWEIRNFISKNGAIATIMAHRLR